MKYYPVFMDIEGQECLIVGAGAVAARKARTLLDCGARVTVIGEEPVPALRKLQSRGLQIRPRAFRKGDMKHYGLVFGATDSEAVNREVSRLSRSRRIPVNIVDDPEKSSFIVPALFRRGELALAVSTSGKSPALARLIREDLGRHYGKEYGTATEILGSFRDQMARRVPGQRRRAAVWKRILGAGLMDILRLKGRAEARRMVSRHIREAAQEGGGR